MNELSADRTTPHFVLSHEGELHGQDTPENRQLVRRIQACEQACEGISTDELERGIVADTRRVIVQVLPIVQAHSDRKAA
jgi:hypothetical protein